MLPSMPIISTPTRSLSPDEDNVAQEESRNQSISIKSEHSKVENRTTTHEYYCFSNVFDFNNAPSSSVTSRDPFPHQQSSAGQLLAAPLNSSSSPSSFEENKTLPLTHATPIFQKYSVHRQDTSFQKSYPHVILKHDTDSGTSSNGRCDIKNGFSDVNVELITETLEIQHPPSPLHAVQAMDVEDEAIEQMEEEPIVCSSEADCDPPSSPVPANENKDNDEDLAALMRASSTIAPPVAAQPNKANSSKRPSRHAKEVEATLACLLPENPTSKEDKEDYFVAAFLNKVREELTGDGEKGEAQFEQLLGVLQGTEEILAGDGGVAELYARVCAALQGHPQLVTEFLAFLEPDQALQCGQLMEQQEVADSMDFLNKLALFFSKQPNVVRMVVSSLNSLAEQQGVSEDDVKATVLPLLRSSPLLTDRFLKLLPSARLPESMMDEWDELDLDEAAGRGEDDETFEILQIPVDIKKGEYGGDTCICSCHINAQDERLGSRSDHCLHCGLKFISGKVYLHSGKTLRPAKIMFADEDRDSAIKRLSVNSPPGRGTRPRKRAGNSFSQDPASAKDSPPKSNLEADPDDPDRTNFTSPKSSRGKRANPKAKDKNTTAKSKTEVCKVLIVEVSPDAKSSPLRSTGNALLSPTGSSSCDTLPAPPEELSPNEPDGTPGGEVGSGLAEGEEEEEEEELLGEEIEEEEEEEEEFEEMVDESSQEQGEMAAQPASLPSETPEQPAVPEEEPASRGSSPSERSGSLTLGSPASSGTEEEVPRSRTVVSPDTYPCWTRDEDKAILQAFQQGGTAQRMLLTVRQLLPERTAEQIMSRFQILLKLLQQMSSAARESSKK